MTKADLQNRNQQLVKECNKETERADSLARLMFDVYEAMDVDDWMKLPSELRKRVMAVCQ